MTAVVERTPTVTCPDCGAGREVSETTLRRIRNHEPGASERCWSCRRVDPCERYRRWWLQQAGVSRAELVRAGGSAAWVRANGLPEVLWEMAASMESLLMRTAA